MKKLLFLLILAGSNHVLSAKITDYSNPSQAALSGSVVDAQSHKPLIGATIFIPDLKAGAVTDAAGHYVIRNLPQGNYQVEVRYTGYTTRSGKILIKSTTQKNWELTPAIVEGNEVLITGVSKATEVRKQPSHISVLSYKQLQQTATDNIIGKIAELPGVSAISTGPDIMKPVIRGLSYNRVVVVNNGVRQEGQQWGDEHGIEIDSYSAGKIEVLRGPASLMYGSDALGGVVNILPTEPAPEGHIKADLISNYQTNNGLIAFHGDIKGSEKGLIWQAYATDKMAHDYKNKYDGYVFNSKFRETDFGAEIGLNKRWGYSHLFFSSYGLHIGLPEGERDRVTGQFMKEVKQNNAAEDVIATRSDFLSYHPFIARQHVQHNKLTWDNKIRIGAGDLDLTFGYQQNHRREYENVLKPQEAGLYMKLNTFNYNMHYSLAGLTGWQTTIGINGMQQINKNAGSEVLIPEYHLFDAGLFAITQKTIHRFTFTGGLRYDIRFIHSKKLIQDNKIRFNDLDKRFLSYSGSAGFSYEAGNHLILKANISRGFRSPSISELASNGVHDGTVRYERGNPGLKPEISTEFDAGAAFNSTHLIASLYGYYNSIQHYIYSRKLLSAGGGDSIRTTSEGLFTVYKFEPTNAHLYGLEASIDIHPHPLDWLHFKNTFSFVRGVNVNGSDSVRNLPLIPAAKLLTALGFNFHHTGPVFHHVYLTLQANNTFAQNHFFSAYGTETATPAYTLFNIEAGTDVTNKNKKVIFSIYVSAKNLTNVAYQDHLSRLKYFPENPVTGRRGIFNMGRNFSFKIIIPVDIKE